MNENVDREGDSVSDDFEKLINEARSGDPDAVGKLLANYRNYLLLIANQDLDLNLRSKLGASDVVQESMMMAQQNINQFRGNTEKEFLGWLRTILVNDMHNQRRQFKTQKRDTGLEVNIQEQSSVKNRLIDGLSTPSTDAIQKERAKILADALDQLTEDHRQVIELRNFEQMDFEAIGQQMNRTAGAARKLWARAVEALQTNLSHASEDLFSQIMHPDVENE